jgi:hypothetical protein
MENVLLWVFLVAVFGALVGGVLAVLIVALLVGRRPPVDRPPMPTSVDDLAW